MEFLFRITFLFGVLLACHRKADEPPRESRGLTASDGTACIRIDSDSCIVQEEPVRVMLDPYLSLVFESCSGYCAPVYFPGNKVTVDKFSFEWGYSSVLDTIYRSHYIPDTSEGTIRYKSYELVEVVSKERINPGFEFNLQLSGLYLLSSGLDYFQELNGKKTYVDKVFQCPEASVCEELFNLKQNVKNGTTKICAMKISLRFQTNPEDDLILTALEYENCE